jgi:Protein of unknown function (DUF992)
VGPDSCCAFSGGDAHLRYLGGIGFIIGSQKALNCSFVPTPPGPPEFYYGVINKLGIDLGGTRGGVMTWAVYAPTARAAGFLAGIYAGASAEATVGAGVGANTDKSDRPSQPVHTPALLRN